MPRPSRIDSFPAHLREQLDQLLASPECSDLEATAQLNAWLAEECPQEEPVGKSQVNRRGQKVRAASEKLRQSREIATAIVADLGAAPQSDTGKLLNEMVRSLVFDLMLKLQQSEITSENLGQLVGASKELALTLQRLEAASTDNVKRDAEIRKQAREQAAEDVGAEAKRLGVSKDTCNALIDTLLDGSKNG